MNSLILPGTHNKGPTRRRDMRKDSRVYRLSISSRNYSFNMAFVSRMAGIRVLRGDGKSVPTGRDDEEDDDWHC